MQEEQPETAVRRRQLLRRGATLAAGVAGAGVASAVVANPAQAAPGDPVVQGATNQAGAQTTTIISSSPGSTLNLGNTVGAPLHLNAGPIPDENAAVGSLSYAEEDYWAKPLASFAGVRIHTDVNSNRLVPILPVRLVDTRNAAGRARIFNTPAGAFDGAGRLRPGQTMNVNLEDFVFVGETVFGNVTVTSSTGIGLFTIYPFNIPRPNVSTINFPASSTLSSLANFFNCALGYNESIGVLDAISVFCSGAAGHVIIDLTAFTVGAGEVLADGPFPVSLQASRGSEAARRQSRALARRAGTS